MKTMRRPIGIVAVLLTGSLLAVGTAMAFPAPPTQACPDPLNHYFGPSHDSVPLYSSHMPHSVTQPLGAPIAAGTYELAALAWDGTSTDKRLTQVEPHEYYFIQLLDAADNVLATSNLTVDLVDGTKEAEWFGSVGQVSWAGPDATQVKAIHGNIGFPDLQRVYAVCFAWAPAQTQETTTTTTTTTTVGPPATVSSTTTTTTTTSLVPTVVLPDVAQSPDPVQDQPSFTG